jgi:hypothetical protein
VDALRSGRCGMASTLLAALSVFMRSAKSDAVGPFFPRSFAGCR